MSMDFVAFLNGAAAAPDVDAEWAQTMRDAAAEIERLKAERDGFKENNASLSEAVEAWSKRLDRAQHIIDKREAQLAEMWAALEGLLEWADEYCRTDKAPTYDALHPARQALATGARKEAADVLAAVEAVRKLPFQHTGAMGALFDAYDAYRAEKEGLELVKTSDGPVYMRPGSEASEGQDDD